MRPALSALAGAALALCAAAAAAPHSHAETLLVYTEELPGWASYASNVMYESTEYWSDLLPGTEFYVADSRRSADFSVQWVKEFGVEHVGYALGNRFIEVGLGDSHCMDRWHPYSGRYVAHIMTHEIGHILGYGHSSDRSSIMYPVALGREYGVVETELPSVVNHANFVPFCTARDITSFEYHVSIDDPTHGFDVYVVPSRDSLDRWSDDEPFKHYSSESCYGEGYLKYGGRCESVSGSGGLLIITGDELSERLVTITAKYREVSAPGGSGFGARSPPVEPDAPRQPTPGGGADAGSGRADPVPVPPEAPSPDLPPDAPAPPASADVRIMSGSSVPGCEASGTCYVPSDALIGAGGTVTWTNGDRSSHTVVEGTAGGGPGGGFDSGLIGPRSTFAHTFAAAGSYPYYCVIHPWMSGTVSVRDGGGAGRGGAGIVADRGTVAIDSGFYSIRYGQTVYATVSGMLYDREDGDRVAITITRPDGSTDGGLIRTTETGRFSLPVTLDSESPTGTYEVLATFRGKVVGITTFQVDGSTPPPVPARTLPTPAAPSPPSSPAPAATPDPPPPPAPAAPAQPPATPDPPPPPAPAAPAPPPATPDPPQPPAPAAPPPAPPAPQEAQGGPAAPSPRPELDAVNGTSRHADATPPPDLNPSVLCGPGTALDEDGVCQIVEGDTRESPASGGGGCLVATAAYGTELAPQVQALRELRDTAVRGTDSGAALVDLLSGAYYTFSPAVADLERQSPALRQAVLAALTPIIAPLALAGSADAFS